MVRRILEEVKTDVYEGRGAVKVDVRVTFHRGGFSINIVAPNYMLVVGEKHLAISPSEDSSKFRVVAAFKWKGKITANWREWYSRNAEEQSLENTLRSALEYLVKGPSIY
jgi:hypothetical protein